MKKHSPELIRRLVENVSGPGIDYEKFEREMINIIASSNEISVEDLTKKLDKSLSWFCGPSAPQVDRET